METSTNALSKLITRIQGYVKDGGMTTDAVNSAIKELGILGYSYNYETFPRLANTDQFKDNSNNTPGNLAEALLWKLGKWKSYKK